jgi:phosphoribosylcarboxyaminoimidazole (NCAIR) mutase
MKLASVFLLATLPVFFVPASAQMVPGQAPVPRSNDLPPMVPLASVNFSPSPAARLDTVAVQHEAQELLQAAQSLQPDIELLKQGLLPKDTLDKLKRIEKLSKHLRGTIAPLAH